MQIVVVVVVCVINSVDDVGLFRNHSIPHSQRFAVNVRQALVAPPQPGALRCVANSGRAIDGHGSGQTGVRCVVCRRRCCRCYHRVVAVSTLNSVVVDEGHHFGPGILYSPQTQQKRSHVECTSHECPLGVAVVDVFLVGEQDDEPRGQLAGGKNVVDPAKRTVVANACGRTTDVGAGSCGSGRRI